MKVGSKFTFSAALQGQLLTPLLQIASPECLANVTWVSPEAAKGGLCCAGNVQVFVGPDQDHHLQVTERCHSWKFRWEERINPYTSPSRKKMMLRFLLSRGCFPSLFAACGNHHSSFLLLWFLILISLNSGQQLLSFVCPKWKAVALSTALPKTVFSMASHLDHPHFPSEQFSIAQDTAIPVPAAPASEENKALPHFTCVILFFNSPAKQAKWGEKNDVGFRCTRNIWNQRFWNAATANKERGDLRFSYLLTSLRMFWAFHPFLKACHLIMTLSSLYSPVRTCQSLLRQLIMTWRFPHSSQFREPGYLWVPE